MQTLGNLALSWKWIAVSAALLPIGTTTSQAQTILPEPRGKTSYDKIAPPLFGPTDLCRLRERICSFAQVCRRRIRHRHQGRTYHEGVLDDESPGFTQIWEPMLRIAEGRNPTLRRRDEERQGDERRHEDEEVADCCRLRKPSIAVVLGEQSNLMILPSTYSQHVAGRMELRRTRAAVVLVAQDRGAGPAGRGRCTVLMTGCSESRWGSWW